ncbi:MAG: radical SAM protein [Ruminococcus sp.]|jgi:7-carboxy-7-deazaguanine synthase|nr:radical SAM protein [Ruminococcus sp.]
MKVSPKKGFAPAITDCLPVVEMFWGINGEGLKSGSPAAFIRFSGCNLSCSWCDTAWANSEDCPVTYKTPEDIYNKLLDRGIKNVTLTGGEPLLQKNIGNLLKLLVSDSYFNTEIETNGSIPLDYIRRSGEKISFTVDCKLPSSGMSENVCYKNFGLLGKRDCVKFVAGTEADLFEAARIMKEYSLTKRTNIFISPVSDMLAPEIIADFIVENTLDARLALQLHKIIWGNQKRR